MSTWAWLALIIVATPIAWFLLKVALTFAIPERISGALLFKQELKKLGIPYEHLPNEFFAECVARADKVSSFTGYGSKLKKKAEYVRTLENLAQMVSLWRREPDSQMFASHGNAPSTYRTLFEKYDLR